MLKQLPMTARLNNAESVNRNLQRPRRKTKVRQDFYCRTRESSVCIKDTDNSLFLFSLLKNWFQQFKLLRDDCVLMIVMIRTIAWLASLVLVIIMLYLPVCLLSVIGHILTNQVLRCWADGGFENSKKSLQIKSGSTMEEWRRVFARSASFECRNIYF